MTEGLDAVDLYARFGQTVERAIIDHEQRLHVPAPERGPLQAIPFANVVINDLAAARAVELLEFGASMHEAAEFVGAPVPALERKLADFRCRWHRFLRERERAV